MHYTDGLSQTEVTSRLKALAETIDSRGWAIKNVPMNAYNQPVFGDTSGPDRLMGIDDFAQEVPNYDESNTTDVLDEQNNPIAQQFDQLITASKQTQRQHIMTSMQQPQPQSLQPVQPHPAPGIATQGSSAVPYWFTQHYGASTQPQAGVLPQAGQQASPMVNPTYASDPAFTPQQAPVQQLTTSDESNLLQQLHKTTEQQSLSSAHMRTIQPLGQGPVQQQPQIPLPEPVAPVTRTLDPVIIDLANNNDLNVATIAREANKHSKEPPDEVVISLH